jgi:phytoene dehydrogenase-like protein
MRPIVILGAGMAGLQAATQLHRKNSPFLLLEKSDRPGGRVQSDIVAGFILDHGFQVLQTNYPSIQQSLDLQALNLQAFDSGAALWQKGLWTSFLNPLRSGMQFLSLVPHVISIKDLFLLGRLWFKLQWSSRELNLSKESTAEMLNRWGFSDTFQTKFLRPFFRGIYLDENLSQPATLFFFYMRQFLEGQAALPAKGMGEIANQLVASLPADSIRFGAEVIDLSANQLVLKGGESLDFERVIIALDPYSAAKLLEVNLDDSVHLGSKTFYFSSPAREVKDKLLHLIPGESKLLHYCFLSHVATNYAPKGNDLIQVTTLDLTLEPEEALRLLSEYEDVKKLKLLKAYAIPRSLAKVGSFDALKLTAESKGFILAGDYCEMPSLEGALASGKKAVANRLV